MREGWQPGKEDLLYEGFRFIQLIFDNNTGTASKKPSNEKDYSNYLIQKYPCQTPGKNAAVSMTGGLLRKAVADEKTGKWLERELAKAPDYIEAAQKSAIAHGSTIKFVSIEFGEEYSTMTTWGRLKSGAGWIALDYCQRV